MLINPMTLLLHVGTLLDLDSRPQVRRQLRFSADTPFSRSHKSADPPLLTAVGSAIDKNRPARTMVPAYGARRITPNRRLEIRQIMHAGMQTRFADRVGLR